MILKTKLLINKKVLLIEEDEVHRMLLTLMITNQGAEVIIEPDRENAIRLLKDQNFDLILMDTRFGNTNALEFTRELRSDLNLSIPIIGMSSVDLRGRGIYNGLDAVLIRPVEYPDLQKTLLRLIKPY